jgi:flagellar hook protein FlgE
MVKDLKVMSADNQYYPPEETKAVTLSGNLDPNDTDVDLDTGKGQILTFSFYDKIGDAYTVKLSIKQKSDGQTPATAVPGTYEVSVVDVLDSNSDSIFVNKIVDDTTGAVTYAATGATFSFGDAAGITPTVDTNTGEVTITGSEQDLIFSTSTGDFVSVQQTRTNDAYTGSLNFSITTAANGLTGNATTFPQYDSTTDAGGVNVFFNSLTQYSQGGTSKLSSVKGDADGLNAGNVAGKMTGISIDQEGKIWGSYDNGMKKCLAQLAVATFSNPSGLESVGNSLFAASLNSGEFDGVGEEISLSGSFTVGALEMSNVDLATEFTQMITTQRGFQANSRIITTSDSMLEELVNLKR